MQRTKRTPQQKAEALRLLAEIGLAEAARRTGIPAGTIASWGHREGVTSPDPADLAKAHASRQVAWAERRIELGEDLGRVASKALRLLEARVDEERTTGVRDLAASIAVLVDKAQLLTGGATGRMENVQPQRTPEHERELAKVLRLVDAA